MKKAKQKLRGVAGLALGGAVVLSAVHAEVPQTLYDFDETSSNGYGPYTDLLAAADGNFYAADKVLFYLNQYGNQVSQIFRLTPAGALSIVNNTNFAYLYCPWTCNYSDLPPGSLIQGSDSNFYGTTSVGAVFQLTPGGTYTSLHAFTGGDGDRPQGALVQGGTKGTGPYWGTTSAGDKNNTGNIFHVNKDGTGFAIAHTFSALDASGHNVDGAVPMAGMVVGSDLNFYGTTSKGGANGVGTVFRITPQGVFTTLHSFNLVADGGNPMGPLMLANDGNFYGTALNGGANGDGTIYRIGSDGTFKKIHAFTYSDGRNPSSRLVEVDKGTTQYLYGSTKSGGANDRGTLYSITTTANFKSLYTFSSVDGNGTNLDGASPNGFAVGQDANLYATTQAGGISGAGTAFEWILQTPVVTIKASPKKVSAGASATLTWSSTSAASCVASGAWSGSQPISGTQELQTATAGSFTYTLKCTGPLGSATQSATLTVTN